MEESPQGWGLQGARVVLLSIQTDYAISEAHGYAARACRKFVLTDGPSLSLEITSDRSPSLTERAIGGRHAYPARHLLG